jgi:hypothetical protein
MPVHTFDTDDLERAMLLRDNGTQLLRFGNNGMGIRNVDDAPTHDPNGKGKTGEKMDLEDFLFTG